MRPFQINVILVKSLYENNIGATSRAMANMGANQLILIDKKCEITFSAQQAAASGQKAFLGRREYENWDDFFANEPEGIRIAFSARDGKSRPLWDFAKVLNWLKTEEPRMTRETDIPIPIYLIFGPEDAGLANEDLELSHFNANIPIWGENPSLNLAQAVLLALFILRTEWGGDRKVMDKHLPSRFPIKNKSIFPEKALHTWLTEMGFDIGQRKVNAYSILKRVLLHNVPTQKELRILDIVLNQSIRKLREYNEMRRDLKN